jgi:preprotein translocase subunit SecD
MRGADIMVHDRPDLVLSGTDIAGAEAGHSTGYSVLLTLTSGGSRMFEDFTRRNVGRRVAVIAYGRLLMAPNIAEPISGSIELLVGRKREDAIALAARINGRELPAPDAE